MILAYNHAAYVEQCLDSAFAQIYADLRVVIFDDASADNTADVIRAYLARSGADATFVDHEINQGLCSTLNEALALVDTEFVAFISADDWMEPNRFAVQVRELTRRGKICGLAYSDMYVVDTSGKRRDKTYIEQFRTTWTPGRTPPDGDAFLDQLRSTVWSTPSILLRREVFEVVGYYDESLPMEDFDMYLRVAREFEIAYIPEQLVNYRITPESLWSTLNGDVLRLVLACQISLLKHLGAGAESDNIIAKRIGGFTKAMYLGGRSAQETLPDLVLSFQHHRQITTFLYLVAARLRIPGRRLNQGVALFRKAKLRLRFAARA